MAGIRQLERPTRDELARIVEEAGSYNQAARVLGISESTVRRWCLAATPPVMSTSLRTPGGVGWRSTASSPATETVVREVDPDEVRALRRQLERKDSELKALRVEVRDSARTENLRDDILDLLRPVATSLAFPAPRRTARRVRDRARAAVELVVHLTDVHWGELVDPVTVGQANAYSPGIAARRIQHVVDTVRTYAADQPGGVSRIVLAVNGDTASGQHIIHPDSADEYARIAKQVLDAAAVVAQVAIELADLADEVLVIGTQGNHPRSTRKMPTGKARVESSWETLLHEFIAAFTIRVPAVTVRVARAYTVTERIGPSLWAFSHGDATAGGGGALGIPAYGLKRKHDANREWSLVIAELTQQEITDAVVRHSRTGHFHTFFAWQAGRGDIALCPSIKGIDSYVLDKLGRYSPAACLLEVVHPERDVIGQHLIDVQHITTEAGECRYVWGALESDAPTAQIVDEWAHAQ